MYEIWLTGERGASSGEDEDDSEERSDSQVTFFWGRKTVEAYCSNTSGLDTHILLRGLVSNSNHSKCLH